MDAAQTHIKNNYMRHPLAFEVFNEEVANLLKRKIKASLHPPERPHHRVRLRGRGDDPGQRADPRADHRRPPRARSRAPTARRTTRGKQALERFACNLEKAFYGFEADFFQQNLSRIVDDVVNDIRGALELWPTLVEICYFRKHKRDLPQTRVRNEKRE